MRERHMEIVPLKPYISTHLNVFRNSTISTKSTAPCSRSKATYAESNARSFTPGMSAAVRTHTTPACSRKVTDHCVEGYRQDYGGR